MVPGLGAARPAFPGREFQSHLTVPLRRLYDMLMMLLMIINNQINQ